VDTFKGKPTKAKYNAASVYVDHASRFIFVKCHFPTGGSEAVAGKTIFEHLAASNGIKVKAYRADNGIMACQEYVNHVKINQQNITYCGVNAHEQNGIAERGIRTLCDRVRTMLIHAMEHWPDVVTLDLWPFALHMATDIHNATPGPSGLSPEEIFTQQKSCPDRLLDFHTFGCPVFVLEPSLQQGHKIPKWQPRARQAIYLGHSPRHAQTVPIVLNINTGLCSPQYHVVFDDYFTTMQSRTTNQLPPEWDTLFMHNRIYVLDGEEELQRELQLAPEWNETASTRPTPAPPQFMTPIDTIGPAPADHGASSQPSEDPPAPEEAPPAPERLPVDSNISADDVSMPPIELSGPRLGWNSGHHHNTRFKARFQANLSAAVSQHRSMEDILRTNKIQDQFTAMLTTMEQQHCLDDGTLNAIYPCALQNDVLHYGKMLKAPDKTKFVEAMEQEVDGLRDMLQVIPRSSLPDGVKPLPAIWAFKRKRLLDWSIQKYKARLNAHGGKQKHGVNYWETYAPVVNWSTVRLTLILSLLHGLKSRQVDFVQAFTQAPLDCPVYLEIPAGYHVKDGNLTFAGETNKNHDKSHVLKLLKNMYGLKQAGYNWYNKLTDVLLDLGFKQSAVNKCLFICQNCVILVYVDDCLLFSSLDATLDAIIAHLKKHFNITLGSDIETYLGIEIIRHEVKTITLRQPGLISKVLTLCGLDNESNEHMSPADSILQPPAPTDEARTQSWSYRQVIGILDYIAATSRPDITFAVHQCARFSANPTRKHELAVRRIAR